MTRSIMRLILGMIHDRKMGDNQATITALHFHPHDQWVRVQWAGSLGSENEALDTESQESRAGGSTPIQKQGGK